ncbi:transposase [Peribacillus sp. NPDC096379]|uniref:IS110 family transposase n=1 Tax=Peribacillus sp. NPDC096379 TaxID=3364393 RepID=UPI00382F919A
MTLFIREVDDVSGGRTPIVLESTRYHIPIVRYFEDSGYLLMIMNPHISYRAKSSNLHKLKSDVIDAHHLCKLYYKEDIVP